MCFKDNLLKEPRVDQKDVEVVQDVVSFTSHLSASVENCKVARSTIPPCRDAHWLISNEKAFQYIVPISRGSDVNKLSLILLLSWCDGVMMGILCPTMTLLSL